MGRRSGGGRAQNEKAVAQVGYAHLSRKCGWQKPRNLSFQCFEALGFAKDPAEFYVAGGDVEYWSGGIICHESR